MTKFHVTTKNWLPQSVKLSYLSIKKRIYICYIMRLYINQSPRKLANKIYAFCITNEAWTIMLDYSGEVWIHLMRRRMRDKPEMRKDFKISYGDGYATIYRIKRKK